MASEPLAAQVKPSDSDDIVGCFIEGAQRKSTGEPVEIVSPATGLTVRSGRGATESDADGAVASAKAAHVHARWRGMSPSKRKAVLHRLADAILVNAGALDDCDAEEMGKPVSLQFCNAGAAAKLMRFCAEALDKAHGEVFCSDVGSYVSQRRVPRGVVAAIVPWNFPTFNAILKAAPALSAGNSVVLKPSELAPSSAFRLAQLAIDCGLPPGVLNVLAGSGPIVGRALGIHMDVDMLAFTGSSAVGKKMLEYSSQSNMKVVMSECGGKSPHLVFADADLEEVADHISRLLLTNQGQVCSTGSRVLVHRSSERPLIDLLASRFAEINVGNPLDTHTTYGPLASSQHLARVMSYIEQAKGDGAEVVTGGERLLPETGGFYLSPTLLANVSHTWRVAREEIFGPVLTVTPFDSEEEAIQIANDTDYGLMTYVWTRDLSRALRVADAIPCSMMVNAVPPGKEGAGYAFSHEPLRQSGIGTESGMAGIESYCRRQLLWFNHA